MTVISPMQTAPYTKLSVPQDSLLTINITWLNKGMTITDRHFILALWGISSTKVPATSGGLTYYRGSLVLASIVTVGQQGTDTILTVATLDPGTYDLYLAMYEKVNTSDAIPATTMDVDELHDRVTGLGQAFLEDPVNGKILGDAWFTAAIEVTAAVITPTITNFSIVWS